MGIDEDAARLTDAAVVHEARAEIQRAARELLAGPLDPVAGRSMAQALDLAPGARISLERISVGTRLRLVAEGSGAGDGDGLAPLSPEARTGDDCGGGL